MTDRSLLRFWRRWMVSYAEVVEARVKMCKAACVYFVGRR